MNELERALCRSVRRAHRRYEKITDNWLFHAPEHFLQNFIFLDLALDREVYAEATRKKITAGSGRLPVGRPPRVKASRYDLVVWNKAKSDTLRAVIEIKRGWCINEALKRDAVRVRNSLKGAQKAKAGYLLVYSEIPTRRGREALAERFGDWASTLGLQLLRTQILATEGRDGWIAGFSLMRA
jgi:hypothetical protein